MKITTILLALTVSLFYSNITFSQEYEDIIYLKSGGTVKGTIVEFSVADQTVKIKTESGKNITYKFSEIAKTKRKESTSYGGVFGGLGYAFSIPTGGDPKAYSGSGFSIYAYEGGILSRYFGFKVDLQFCSFSKESFPPHKIDDRYMSLAVMLDLMGGNFNPKSRFFYYGILGAGMNVGAVPKIETPQYDPLMNDTIWTKNDNDAVTHFGLHLGAGAGFRIFRGFAITTEIQYNFIGAKSTALSYIPIRFGLTFMPK
jgi:hypothetical protein